MRAAIYAEGVKQHYPDVQVLIFSTALKVSKHEEALWAAEILDKFGLQLVVVSREEFITWLRDPANSDICRDQLGIAPSMAPELEPAFKHAQEAAKEVADNWDRMYWKAGRPLINLSAVELDDRGNPVEVVTTASLGTALSEGQRIILEAPAGSGKTTALVQFAQRILSTGGLLFLVDLPEWVSSHRNILLFVSEEMRPKLRAYLKRGAELGTDPEGLRANTRAHLAQLLANVGEREDLADIRRLIEADSIRFQRAQEARRKGDRSHDETGYGLLYFDAVTMVDPVAADQVLVDLIGTQEYEWVLAQRLPGLARKSTSQLGFGTNRMDFGKIWKSREGESDESFVEERRSRFADAIREGIVRIQREREGAADKRGFDYRLKILGGALAALDGKRSANLVLEVMKLPGRWDGWTRVGTLENLLVSGVRLSLEEVLRVLDPTMQELRSSGMYNDNQSVWLFARCLCVMAFVDPPAEGVAKIRELVSSLRFPAHELGIVVAALGASRCDDAIDFLMEFAGPDGKGLEAIGETWIEAIGALRGPRSNEILLSFVDPDAKLFTREFIPDHRNGDLLARLLAERAEVDGAVKAELVRLANDDLSPLKRMLLAKVFARFRREEDLVAGLSILRDDGTGVPYELFRSMESAFLEHRPYGSGGNTFTLVPRGSNAVRKRLFEMSQNDPLRKLSAFALLGQIEVWRLEHGRPADEPRHPAIESDISWPPLLS